jgi:tRNA threonylcarbamoyladenosine biosynthesis protein TsaB
MFKLFVDTSYDRIHFILIKDKEVLKKELHENITKTSDVFTEKLESFLKTCDIKTSDLGELYITNGPGSFTGVRVAVTFAKTLKVINPSLVVKSISSLLFQAGIGASISYIDARGGNTYFAVYNEGQAIICDQVLDQVSAVAIANEFDDYLSYYDLHSFDFEKNFIDLIPFFKEIEDINTFEPNYIKKFG